MIHSVLVLVVVITTSGIITTTVLVLVVVITTSDTITTTVLVLAVVITTIDAIITTTVLVLVVIITCDTITTTVLALPLGLLTVLHNFLLTSPQCIYRLKICFHRALYWHIFNICFVVSYVYHLAIISSMC